MIRRLVWTMLLLDFAALNVWAMTTGSWQELERYLTHLGPFGVVATVDLVLALSIGVAWTWSDARKKKVSPWPWALLTLGTGSLGLLAYLARHGGTGGAAVESRRDGTLAARASRTLPLPADRVWAVLADFHHVDRFHPYVQRVETQGAASCGVGAERVCHLRGMPDVRERVTEWEVGRGYRIEATSKMDWLGKLGGKLWVEPAAERASAVHFELTLTPRFGVAGRAMGRAMLGHLAGSMGTHVLASLEHHLLTGDKLPARGGTDTAVHAPQTA